jgi:hypothetical protein
MPRTIQECSVNFIRTLNAQSRRRPIDIRSQHVWIDGALMASAGAGNPPGTRLNPSHDLRARIEQLLTNWRFQLADVLIADFGGFDTSIKNKIREIYSCCEETNPECWLQFGRIQKICNIWLKYHFALYFSGFDNTFTQGNPWLNNLINYAHVPIDRTVLNFLSRRHPIYTNLGHGRLSWKRDLQEPRYITLQNILRTEAQTNAYNSSLHYEMDMIWTSNDDT